TNDGGCRSNHCGSQRHRRIPFAYETPTGPIDQGKNTSYPGSLGLFGYRVCGKNEVGGHGLASFLSDAAHGENHLVLVWIFFDFGAQALHMDINYPGITTMPVSPDFFKQFFTSQHLTGSVS